ncbi:hypothetical protein DF048_07115 [Burkholderia seminalis]|nr:hypothetical protein DF048_07115 [Burkholderia seminalis]
MGGATRCGRCLKSCPEDRRRRCCVTSSLLPSTDAHAATPAPCARRKPRATGLSMLASELH